MNTALILSGGIGSRISSDIPKQYIKAGDKMIISRCLEVFLAHEEIDCIEIAADKSWRDMIRAECGNTDKLKGFSEPGENRQLSILNGLKSIAEYAKEDDMVLIQDAVRPMVSAELISRILSAAKGHEGAVPVLPLKDTVYLSEDGKRLTKRLERSKILAGQAPEVFLLGRYLKANEALSHEEILRISGSAEPALISGMDIATLPGDEGNFKITTDADLKRFIRFMEEETR